MGTRTPALRYTLEVLVDPVTAWEWIRSRLIRPVQVHRSGRAPRRVNMQITLETDVVQVGKRFVAFARPGGFQVRGTPALTAEGAFRNLLWTLSGNGPQNDDAELGIALLVEGTTLTDVQRAQAAALPEAPAAQTDGDRDPWTEPS
jgi:hypothetical protein